MNKLFVVTIPKESFPALVEGFLNEGKQLYLYVEELTVTKKFGCDHCIANIEITSPDDDYIILSVYKKNDSKEIKIKCHMCGKENIRYWVKQAGGHVFSSR